MLLLIVTRTQLSEFNTLDKILDTVETPATKTRLELWEIPN